MVEAMSKHNEKGLVHAMLQGIRDGKGKLEAMLEFVTAAQCRVFSAAAVVYPAIDEAESPRYIAYGHQLPASALLQTVTGPAPRCAGSFLCSGGRPRP